MIMIVAVSQNWGIGKDGRLLFSIPQDMKFFREKTKGATVILGRTTLESLPGGRPLKGRDNIVMSSNTNYVVDGATVVHDLSELFSRLKDCKNQIYVIGGAGIYSLLEPYCKQAYITKIDATPQADKYFPNLDAIENWTVVEEGMAGIFQETAYRVIKYQNNNVKAF